MKKFIYFRLFIAVALIAAIGFSFGIKPRAYAQTAQSSVDAEIYMSASDPIQVLGKLDETKNAKNVREEYKLKRVLDVAYGKVYKYQQRNNGYDVYGSELAVSVDKQGKVLSVVGEYKHIPTLNGNMSEQDAVNIVLKQNVGSNVLSVEKKIYCVECAPTLAYEITVDSNGGYRYFISAVNGKVLSAGPASAANLMATQTDAYGDEIEVNIEYEDGMYYLADDVRNIYAMNAHNSYYGFTNYTSETDNDFDPIAVTAYANTTKAYDFYTNADNIGVSLHGVSGQNDDISGNVDDRDDEIPIFVVLNYGQGQSSENLTAAYDKRSNNAYIYVGSGNRFGNVKEPAKGLDSLAHEYHHLLSAYFIDFGRLNDAGALNEAFSDMFGALIEGHDMSSDDFWHIGEDMGVRSGYIRSLSGGTEGQKYTIDERVPRCTLNHDHSACDYGGVHANSTIATYVQYQLYEQMPEYFTPQRVGKLWYSTWCMMTTNATFEDFGYALWQSALNLEFSDEACTAIYNTLKDGNLMPQLHKITFLDENDNVISESLVRDGDKIKFPADPIKESTDKYDYVFVGWDNTSDIATKDMVIKPRFNEVARDAKSEDEGNKKDKKGCGTLTFVNGGGAGLGGMLIITLMLLAPLVLLPMRKNKKSKAE